MRKRIISIILTIVMSLTLFTGCSLFEYDAARDYKQVVVTIDSVEIPEVAGANGKVFTTEKKKIYKYELVNSINGLNPSVFQSYTVEEVIDILLDQLVQRQLVLNEADAQIYFGNIVWGVNEENQVRKSIYASIDQQLATIRNEILTEHGESIADTEGTQKDAEEGETTYPTLEEEVVGEYDDYTKEELAVLATNKKVAYDEAKNSVTLTDEQKAVILERYSEYSKTKLIAVIENFELQSAEEWKPAKTSYPGLYGSEDVRSLEIEAMRRFINMMKNTIKEDYRISDSQRRTFLKEISDLEKVANEKGVSYVYPEIGYTQFMEFIVGTQYRENVKISLLEAHITQNIDVTEEEVLSSYNDLLAEQQDKYATAEDFYSDMSGGNTNIVYYPSSDYYYVKHILVPFSSEQTAQLSAYKSGQGALLGEDAIAKFKENLGKQVKGFEHRNGENYGYPLTIDKIYADITRTMAAAEGSLKASDNAFEKLIYKYNTDDGIFGNELGYAVKAKFGEGEEYDTTYMEEFSRAADELFRAGVVGAISQPVATDYGVHILYLSKIPTAGETLALNDYLSYGEKTTVYELLEDELRSSKTQNEFYKWQNAKVGFYQTVKKIVTINEKSYADLIKNSK